MNQKDYLKRLDEFLAAFDVEELIKDGIEIISFRYQKNGNDIQKVFTINEFEKVKEQRKCNL